MKIQVTAKTGYFTHDFKLVDSICKTHYKELMKVATGYDYKEKTGSISERNTEKFLNLVEKIEKSNASQARKSHAKTVEKAKERKNTISCTLSFEDYCEEYLDQHLALMSHAEKVAARKRYREITQ